MKKVKIVTCFTRRQGTTDVLDKIYVQFIEGGLWQLIYDKVSKSASDSETVGSNSEEHHQMFDQLFGEDAWDKEWIGQIPNGPLWQRKYPHEKTIRKYYPKKRRF